MFKIEFKNSVFFFIRTFFFFSFLKFVQRENKKPKPWNPLNIGEDIIYFHPSPY